MDKMRRNKRNGIKKVKRKKKVKCRTVDVEGRQENWDLKKRSIIAIRFSCLEAKGNGWPYKWRNTWKLSYPIRRENSFLINELHSILPLCVPEASLRLHLVTEEDGMRKCINIAPILNFSSIICRTHRILESFLE